MNGQYKVVRDSVHGDIYIENKYLNIIDTPEFQRLRRIKQLSVGNLIFPGAEHTRFTHSIGTFFIMKKIIEHFDEIFNELHIKNIETCDKEVALVAALLHDIGHGPFSHAFEAVLTSQCSDAVDHVKMSIEIILCKSSQINKVLVDGFDEDFPQKVADTIEKKKNIKEGNVEKTTNYPDLQFVLSSLISSQLDADRMDYLLRDAMFTGVKFGNIDLSRIIGALSLAVREKEFCVCINEKYIPDIESYLAGRYQMHKEVYFHDFKCEMELVIKQILLRAKYLFKENNLDIDAVPQAIISLFKGNKLSVQEYITLDDTVLYSLFHKWEKSNDLELSFLCTCILSRNKFKKVSIMNNEKNIIDEFKKELKSIFEKYEINNEFEEMSFFLEIEDDYKAYKVIKDNIFVINKYGVLEDFSSISKLINPNIKENKNMLYINFQLIRIIYSDKKYSSLVDEIMALVRKYDSRNHIEIEAKYIIRDERVLDKVIETIKQMNGYVVDEKEKKLQKDYYYDTKEDSLQNSNRTLRIRESFGKYFCTIKLPVGTTSEPNSHNERYEHEQEVYSLDIKECGNFIEKYLEEDSNSKMILSNNLIITNNRKKYNITEKNDPLVKFEMVFDEVEYKNISTGKVAKDLQVEIELKSDYIHAVRMKLLTDEIESKVKDLEQNSMSKYKRGLSMTQS